MVVFSYALSYALFTLFTHFFYTLLCCGSQALHALKLGECFAGSEEVRALQKLEFQAFNPTYQLIMCFLRSSLRISL